MSSSTVNGNFSSVKKKAQMWCNTTAKLREVNFKWTIENFSFLFQTKKNGQKLESSIFSAEDDDNIQWKLMLHPKGHSIECKDYISIFLCLVSSHSCLHHFRDGIASKFELSITNEKGENVYSRGYAGDTFVEPFEGKGYRYLKMYLLS